MAAPAFALRVVTPEETVFAGDAVELTAPGSEGSFGILAHHAPLLAALKAGDLSVIDTAGAKQTWRVRDGFLHAAGNTVTVLAALAR